MNITVVGGGYVGVITAVCLCEFGFRIYLCEQNQKQLDLLKQSISPSSEPGVNQLLKKHINAETLVLSTTFSNFISKSFAVVVTIKPDDNNPNLSNIHSAIRAIALKLEKNRYTGVLIKTSLPVGACAIIADNVKFVRPDLKPGEHYDIISNPGFLREGVAIHDFMEPNRILIGLERSSTKSEMLVSKIYKPLEASGVPFIFSNFETVELIRAASIGFVATKMAFINEVADLCERCGANINTVIKGIALDHRIGRKALDVSPGFGGSSFPRTIRTLVNAAKAFGLDFHILTSTIKSNSTRISGIKTKILSLIDASQEKTFPNMISKQVTILGLSFKPQTGDIRESASIFAINDLLHDGNIKVVAYDPMFKPNDTDYEKLPNEIVSNKNFHIAESVYDAVNQSDIVVIMTHWNEFRSLNLQKIKELMNKKHGEKPIILDYRNMFSKSEMSMFNYISQGQ